MDKNRTISLHQEEPDFRALGLPQPPKGDARAQQAGMTVPEGFFDAFRQRMEAAIDADAATQSARRQEQQHRVARLRSLRRWSAAAGIVLIVGIAALIGRPAQQPAAPSAQLAAAPETVADSEADDELLLSGLSDFDIYEAYYAMAD